jgi:23S rRNA (pseudouridine1915-N3)-methyltransferase
MKILIAAIGKAKASPQQELFADYCKRLPWKVELKEFEAKLDDPVKRKAREGELLLEAAAKHDRLVALDERGRDLSSHEFAEHIKKWQSQGNSSLAFIIGGADGLSEGAVKKANLVWSLGRVTWPHMLVRPLLAEQLYRAHTLITGHPYHRQ